MSKRQAVYTGRRLGGTKVYHRFELLPDRKEMFFTGISGVRLGFTYECEAKSIKKRPTRVYERDQEQNPEWEAQDAIVSEMNARRREDQQLAQLEKKNLRNAVEALKPLLRGLDFFDMDKVVSHLVRETRKELSRKARK